MNNPIVPMIFVPLASALVVLFLGSRNAAWVRWATLAATLVTFVLALDVMANFKHQDRDPAAGPIQPQLELRKEWHSFELPVQVGGTPGHARLEFYVGVDGISLSLVLLTAVLMVPAVLVSWTSIQDNVAEYYALLLLLETGMLGVFCAFDIILFYIFFEFTLIPLFFLIGRWGGEQKRYAAAKFFIYTLAGSVISLIGLVALVLALNSRDHRTLTFSIPDLARGIERQMEFAEGATGTASTVNAPANLAELSAIDLERAETKQFWYRTQWWIFLALFCGFAIKVPLVPFHTWLPLAHVQAPTAGSVLLAGVLLKLGTYGFLRLCLPLLPYASWNLGVPLIATLSTIGIIYGSFCALAQEDIKKLVAYSSVSHLGFCMLGMFALNAEGISGAVLQMVNHGLSTGMLFLLVGMLYERYHTRQLSDMSGLAARLPLLSCFMVFTCLSSMGLPGLNGFVGEVLALLGMFKVHPAYAVIGSLGVILGAWYLMSMLQRAFFGPVKEPHHHGPPVQDLNGRELAALVPLALLCIWIGVYPKTFLDTIRPDVAGVVSLYDQPSQLLPPGHHGLAVGAPSQGGKP